MSIKTLNPQHLIEIQNLIDEEFKHFIKEISGLPGIQIFDRAQEIIIKTQFADEIVNGFTETFDNMRDPEDQAILIETIWRIKEEGTYVDMLHGLYLEFLQYQDTIFDPEIMADFLCDRYCDWQSEFAREDEEDETSVSD